MARKVGSFWQKVYEPNFIINFLALLCGTIAYIYTNFATINYVDKINQENKDTLAKIQNSVDSIESKLIYFSMHASADTKYSDDKE